VVTIDQNRVFEETQTLDTWPRPPQVRTSELSNTGRTMLPHHRRQEGTKSAGKHREIEKLVRCS
jgi:hypothetical protein